MNEKQIEGLLEQHGIKLTANRILIAKIMSTLDYPISMKELETMLLTMDKSSIFRTLSLFKSHHLVHQMEDGNDIVRYELCHSHSEEEDEDIHVHFYCEHCHRTFCLNEISVPQVNLPVGYRQTAVNYMIKGICPDCSQR
ncbi:MAG: transcriptional repressor [Prevotella sp.]|jgi:putative ferric uptake regulation protein|uniref:Fur family transcriptional regulator n=2 Tax=Prevotella TaxID=838 RepID=UPI00025BB6E2|nr:transcriptional repressor [Prevotella sp. oral taxon 306]EID33868.1 ferric uptake regulator family protein [Prevotella sp. oral taxon 306 str. F0472]MBF1625871.1 transcriptional repressor [Prevotella sp.]MBF1643039.1 transcriptional repressor [Prevotella sp.]MBF1645689.1 transcriptional repressor [Prevotella sp.]